MKKIKIKVDGLNFYYHQKRVLKDLKAELEENLITVISGPSGEGKSTFLMSLNRIYESIPQSRMDGKIMMKFAGGYVDIHSLSPSSLRKKVGMVFQYPNPLPMSIFKNVAFPLKLSGIKDKSYVAGRVEEVLKDAFLWDEVKDRLMDSALKLSGGQQQRLCISRAMIMQPEVMLLDEPTSSLDKDAADKIEKLLLNFKGRCTFVIVSHDGDLIGRIADRVLTLKGGKF